MTLEDRMARAEDYVFGLMDEHERERAERDMTVDDDFRHCVMVLAERLRRLREQPKSPITIEAEAWKEISRRIASMPQMAGGGAAIRMVAGEARVKPSGGGLHALGGRRGVVVAVALAFAFMLGYLAGTLG